MSGLKSDFVDGETLYAAPVNAMATAINNLTATVGSLVFMPPPSGDTTGATDSANVAAALAKLPITGGSIIWGWGQYWLVKKTVILLNNVHHFGQGCGATILKLAASQNDDFIVSKGWDTYKGTAVAAYATAASVTIPANSSTITAPATTFAGVAVGDRITSTSNAIPSGTIVTAVASAGSGTDQITLSKPTLFAASTAVVNYSHAPANFGLHNLTIDGNSYYNGANQLARPAAPTVTPVGATGTTTYYYKVSALNAVGETVASQYTMITNGNATLSATNYNTISGYAVTGAVSYNIYRGNFGFFTEAFIANTTATSYNDVNPTSGLPAGRSPAPTSDTSPGRALAMWGWGWILEDVEIKQHAGVGWDSQCPSTSGLAVVYFGEKFNSFIKGLTIVGNKGGGARFAGPTDVQAERLNLSQNGNYSTNTTNGLSSFDCLTSGLSVANFHIYGGYVQFGVIVRGTQGVWQAGANEDGAAYGLVVTGNNNVLGPHVMYSTGGAPIAIMNNGINNTFDVNVQNFQGGTLAVGSGARQGDYRINHHYWSADPPTVAGIISGTADDTSTVFLNIYDNFGGSKAIHKDSFVQFLGQKWDYLGRRLAKALSPAPVCTPQAGAGTAPAVSAVGDDTAGKISITIGATPAPGPLVKVAFSAALPNPPYVALTPLDAAGALAGYYCTCDVNGFTVNCIGTPEAGDSLALSYTVIGAR